MLKNKEQREKYMKYSIGYQLFKDTHFVDYLIQNKEKIGEIYFSWGDIPNGRNIQIDSSRFEPYEAIEKVKSDLDCFAKAGIATNVLFNANCYGKDSQSRFFFYKLGETFDFLHRKYNTNAVTTTSILIAKFIKENFPKADVRASVNIGVENSNAAEYIGEYFDSYYAARELNRDREKLSTLRDWCHSNGKKLYGLANSGCFARCPARTFHDNLVSHEREIAAMDNGYDFKGICTEYFKSDREKSKIISGLTFIRPEDVSFYEDVYDGLKLATRVSPNPINTCMAYFSGQYRGGITDLLEPNHSSLFQPSIIDNGLFPKDFAKKTMDCKYTCQQCGYCKEVYAKAGVKLDIDIF